MTVTVECPNCGAQVTWNEQARWRPFCSERCRMVDLGAWFTEERVIPGRDAAEQEGEESGEAGGLVSPGGPARPQ